jgi:hypothetical protein
MLVLERADRDGPLQATAGRVGKPQQVRQSAHVERSTINSPAMSRKTWNRVAAAGHYRGGPTTHSS